MKKKIRILGMILLLLISISQPAKANLGEHLPDPVTRMLKRIIHFVESNQTEPAQVTDEPYQWLKGKDLTKNNLTDKKDILLTIDFDTKTKWPPADKMPPGFDPAQIIEWGKNHELGVDELHEQGYTGQGVNIAVIDSVLAKKHREIRDKLVHYEEVQDLTEVGINFHCIAVASIAVGKDVGVAPGADLYYFAIDEGDKHQAHIAEAIKRIIEFNKKNFKEQQIRLIISAQGYSRNSKGGRKYFNAIQQAARNDILVVEPDLNDGENKFLGWNYIVGAKCPYPKDKNDYDNYQPGRWKKSYIKQVYILQEIASQTNNWIEFEKKLKKKVDYLKKHNRRWIILGQVENNVKRLETKYETISKLKIGIRNMIKAYKTKSLHIPSAGITVASDKGRDEYIFSGSSGISWALPYYGGVAALILQANPHLTNEEVVNLIDKTAVMNENGLRMIAPRRAVKRALTNKQD